MRKLIAALALPVLGLGLLFASSSANATGSASYDLKRDVVSNSLSSGSGARTLTVTCPDGGVAINWGAEYDYYTVDGVVLPSGHTVVGSFDSGDAYTATVTATCVSLAS